MTTPARDRQARVKAMQEKPGSEEESGEGQQKTLLGHAHATGQQADPDSCVLCGTHVDAPLLFAYAPPYPVCRDIPACLERAFSGSPSKPAKDALEPPPEMTP